MENHVQLQVLLPSQHACGACPRSLGVRRRRLSPLLPTLAAVVAEEEEVAGGMKADDDNSGGVGPVMFSCSKESEIERRQKMKQSARGGGGCTLHVQGEGVRGSWTYYMNTAEVSYQCMLAYIYRTPRKPLIDDEHRALQRA